MLNLEEAMDEQGRTLYAIPAENLKRFEEQLAKLSKKSMRLLGKKIEPFVFGHEEQTMADGHKHRVYTVLLTAEVPRIAGWTFMARLDHANETGTIIRMVPNVGSLPEQYRHARNTTCDHCHINRYRRDTFVIRNDETGEYKQVGSTCLKDFFGGQDPYKIAKMAELLGYAHEIAHAGTHIQDHADLRYIDLEDYLTFVANAVANKGWVSGKAAYENTTLVSSRQRAMNNMMAHDPENSFINETDRVLAHEALAWAQSFSEKENLNDYEHNVLVIANATMIEPRSAGIAASIVGVYYTNQEKQRQAGLARNADVGDFAAVIDFFKAAKPKYPKINLQLEDKRPIVLSLAGNMSKFPGTVNITDGGPYGQNIWYGRVSPTGEWQRSNRVDANTMTSLIALLTAFGRDPAKVASDIGLLSGRCVFCRRTLTDERSTKVGYGRTCSEKYHLPYNEG